MRKTIIYNPNSTGDSETSAREAREHLSSHDVTLVATDFAGHGEELARAIAEKNEHHMIISSSGDGGYHEVINGILTAKDHSNIIAGLLPSGNANDHYNALHDGDLVAKITDGDVREIDVLQLSTATFNRYAHSYIGFGVSPQIGQQLNQTKLNRFNEIWIVVKHFFTSHPVKIRFDNRVASYDSLILSNVPRMAKVLSLSADGKPDDGLFEIIATPARSIITTIKHFAKAAVSSLESDAKRESISFTLLHNTLVQLDGEVISLKKVTS